MRLLFIGFFRCGGHNRNWWQRWQYTAAMQAARLCIGQ